MNVGSLFSGIAGIDLGFQREGFETRWFVENEAFCQSVLKKWWPEVPVYGDIREVDFTKLERVDVLVGGFPCQDLSVAGKRKGLLDGERSALWIEYARAIREMGPSIAVVENVPNLFGWFDCESEPPPSEEEIRAGEREVEIEQYQGVAPVLGDLAAMGYDAEWCGLRASDFGALHERERAFIIAYAFDGGCGGRLEDGLVEGQEANGTKVTGRVGARALAHVDELGWESSGSKSDQQARKLETAPRFIAHDFGDRVQRYREESLSGEFGFSWCKNVRGIEDLKKRSDLPVPLIRRTDDEFSVGSYKDRIKALGNAVVPTVAQFVARQIKERLK